MPARSKPFDLSSTPGLIGIFILHILLIYHITNFVSLVIQAFSVSSASREALSLLCSADLWCSIAGETPDRGRNENINKNRPWMIFACGTDLDGEDCNYIRLNNWNQCPPATSSSNRMFNIIPFYTSYILHAVSRAVITEVIKKSHRGLREEVSTAR